MNWNELLSSKRLKALYGLESSKVGDGDDRSEFERDFGRSVFSTPVRRLQDKAQVFPLEEHDAVRTRLTHSLEVSSVARGLGAKAERIALKKEQIGENHRGAIPTIAATCGLIHDLGNPPFGHAGEEAIASWFEAKMEADSNFFEGFKPHCGGKSPKESQFAKDFLQFEGNAQTQRLLSRLQVLADDYGLNLTCATLSASCKYIASSDTTNEHDQAYKKHGYFASENDLMRLLRNETGTGRSRHPITFLVEASDDIVYSTVDLEDGVKKRCLSWEDLEKQLRDRCISESLGQALDQAKLKLLDAPVRGVSRDEAMVSAFRTTAITQMVVAVSKKFEEEYDLIMDGRYPYEILYQSDAGTLAKACKQIAAEHVYVAPQVIRRELMGKEVICDLLDIYWQAANEYVPEKKLKGYSKRIYSLISSNYRHVFEKALSDSYQKGIPKDYFRMQLITDQISGMTDTFAVNLHRELKNG